MAPSPRSVAHAIALLVLVGLVGCAPPPRLDRAPDAAELARLAALRGVPPRLGWSAQGHARFSSPEGSVEGSLQAAVDLPARLRLEVRSRALFGLVGDRLVVALPGDGNVLLYRARTDHLERVPFAASALARYLPTGEASELHALVMGCPPWPGGEPPADLATRARLVGRSADGGVLEFRVQLPDSPAVFEMRLRDGILEFFAWDDPAQGRYEVRYDRWLRLPDWVQPGRLRLRAPREGVEGEIRLEHVERHDGFAARDFEVY